MTLFKSNWCIISLIDGYNAGWSAVSESSEAASFLTRIITDYQISCFKTKIFLMVKL